MRQATVATRLAGLSLPGGVRLGVTAPEPVTRLSSGVPAIDAVLAGGLPRGKISELVGTRSTGRTAVLLAVLAAATRRGEVVACVDCADALHPESVLRAGADLRRLLWVRPLSLVDGLRCAELLLRTGGLAVVALDVGDVVPRVVRGHSWPRLMRAAEQAHTACVVCAPRRLAGSFAALGVGVEQRAVRWHRGTWPLFDGFETVLRVVRNKLGVAGAEVGVGVGLEGPG